MKSIKIITFFVCLYLLLFLFGCKTNNIQTGEYYNKNMQVPPLENGHEIYVMKIDNTFIDYNLFRYYYMSYKDEMDGGNENFWNNNDKAKQELSLTVVDSIKMELAVETFANSNGVSLTSEENDYIDNSCREFIEDLKINNEFTKFLEERYLTEELLYRQEKTVCLAQKVKNYYCKDSKPPLTNDEYFEMLFETMSKMEVVFLDVDNVT